MTKYRQHNKYFITKQAYRERRQPEYCIRPAFTTSWVPDAVVCDDLSHMYSCIDDFLRGLNDSPRRSSAASGGATFPPRRPHPVVDLPLQSSPTSKQPLISDALLPPSGFLIVRTAKPSSYLLRHSLCVPNGAHLSSSSADHSISSLSYLSDDSLQVPSTQQDRTAPHSLVERSSVQEHPLQPHHMVSASGGRAATSSSVTAESEAIDVVALATKPPLRPGNFDSISAKMRQQLSLYQGNAFVLTSAHTASRDYLRLMTLTCPDQIEGMSCRNTASCSPLARFGRRVFICAHFKDGKCPVNQLYHIGPTYVHRTPRCKDGRAELDQKLLNVTVVHVVADCWAHCGDKDNHSEACMGPECHFGHDQLNMRHKVEMIARRSKKLRGLLWDNY